ncbi:histidinol-phosphate transaminase [Candidatus Binatia bacterium]|nr:histidinol-phosphate transaminase [Candidatus Binatia bacterium]
MAKPATDLSPQAYLRPEIAALAGYVPGEQPTDPGVVKLNTNENPYPPSAAVRRAITDACERLHLYPDPSAREVRERVARLYGVDPAGVIVGNGSDELLSLLMRAVIAPGDAVAYGTPTYSLYDTLVALQAGRTIHIPYGPDYGIPRELLSVNARLLIVCNPNAPSGTAVPRRALEELAEARRDVLVVIDEAYADFADENATAMGSRHPNVIVLRTLSKSYSLAGLRVGIGITTPGLAAELNKVKDSYNVSRLAQAGAVAALDDQASMLAHVARVRATRARLVRELERLGYVVPPSQANFVLARRPGRSQQSVKEALQSRGVLVRYFGDLPDALRITVGTDAEIDRLIVELKSL